MGRSDTSLRDRSEENGATGMTLNKRRTIQRPSLIAGLLLIIALIAAPFARAEGNDQPSGAGEGISVAGSGEIKAKPKVVEINATVTGDAELAADAIVKY